MFSRAMEGKIYSCKPWVNMFQGPPGTGKTTFESGVAVGI